MDKQATLHKGKGNFLMLEKRRKSLEAPAQGGRGNMAEGCWEKGAPPGDAKMFFLLVSQAGVELPPKGFHCVLCSRFIKNEKFITG